MACYLVMMGNLVSWKSNAHTSIVSCMHDNDVHLEHVDGRTPEDPRLLLPSNQVNLQSQKHLSVISLLGPAMIFM